MKLIIVRHGQSTNNAGQPRVPDPALTPLGQQQAKCTADALRTEHPILSTLYCSPMLRALQTADPIRALYEEPVHILPDLCESGGMGAERGLRRTDILRDYPHCTLDVGITEEGWWMPDPQQETETHLYARAARAASALRALHPDDADVVAIVTHGTFGSALISVLLGLGACGYTRFLFNNCAISQVTIATTAVDHSADPLVTDIVSVEAVCLPSHNHNAHLPAAMRS